MLFVIQAFESSQMKEKTLDLGNVTNFFDTSLFVIRHFPHFVMVPLFDFLVVRHLNCDLRFFLIRQSFDISFFCDLTFSLFHTAV